MVGGSKTIEGQDIMVDSNSLILFMKIADLGSFSAVAREQNLAKSLVSQRISALEEQLKVRLLNRTTRKVSLTDEGLRLLPLARSVAESVNEVMAYSDSFSQEPSGVLRLTSPHDMGNLIIEQILPEFCLRYPKVRVDIQLSNQYLDLIKEQIDLAIRVSTKGFDDSTYVSKKIFDTHIQLYASPKLKGIEALKSPSQLNDFPLIQTVPNKYIELRHGDNIEKIPYKNLKLTCRDMQGAMRAVKAGLGIALLPKFLAKSSVDSGDLISLLDTMKIPSGNFYMVYPSRSFVPRKTRVFMEMLMEHFRR